MRKQVEANVCALCGHIWLGKESAKRCPNRRCRATQWNSLLVEEHPGPAKLEPFPKCTVKWRKPQDESAKGATMPVVQSVESHWPEGTSLKTMADFRVKYGCEPHSRAEAESFCKWGY